MPRVFPHDLEAERSLLGSMLISKEACQDILNKCEDRDFYEESHKVLFNAMSELSRQNIPVDVTTITSLILYLPVISRLFLIFCVLLERIFLIVTFVRNAFLISRTGQYFRLIFQIVIIT